jgi:hypothetical protein
MAFLARGEYAVRRAIRVARSILDGGLVCRLLVERMLRLVALAC